MLLIGARHRLSWSSASRTRANFNDVMVAIKLTIVLVVIFVGFCHIVPANHTPFIPPNTGTSGSSAGPACSAPPA